MFFTFTLLTTTLLLTLVCLLIVFVAPFRLDIDAGAQSIQGEMVHPVIELTWRLETAQIRVVGKILEIPFSRVVDASTFLPKDSTPKKNVRPLSLDEVLSRAQMARHIAGDAIKDYRIAIRPAFGNPFVTGVLSGFFHALNGALLHPSPLALEPSWRGGTSRIALSFRVSVGRLIVRSLKRVARRSL